MRWGARCTSAAAAWSAAEGSEMHIDELHQRFVFHAPRPGTDDAARHVRLREACEQLAQMISREVPECREQSLAVTAIEEAMMWANAALARHRDRTPPIAGVPA